MDSLTTATATAMAGAGARSASERPSDKAAISSDFETFLRMLTAQLQNQDPLNPVESTDFAVQLATFSGVEQQVLTNKLLERLGEAFGGSGLAQYGSWVGMEGRAAVPAQFDGTPLSVLPRVDPEADSAQLVVRNAEGREVQRQAIATDGAALSWAGLDANGNPLAPGSYSFLVQSYAGGAHISEAPAEVYARITEVRAGDAGATVVFEGGAEVGVGAISGLRATPG